MRKELKKLDGQRELFIAKFERVGTKSGFKGAVLPTILLKDVTRVSDKKLMCDHLWLNKTKAFAELKLVGGVEIQFAARVKEYTKGYQGKKEDVKKSIKQDFKLSHPTQVSLVENDKNGETTLIIRKKK